MADKKPNFFKRIGATFKGVVLELKKVIWPTKEKLKQTSAVCLAIIVFFAIYLTALGSGARWLLEKIGFYDVAETTVTETTVAVPETTAAETTAADTSEG